MKTHLSIIIVNWNSREQLRECIASIPAAVKQLPATVVLDKIVVVDNASVDGSQHELRAAGCDIELISNHKNRGFAAACNQGAASCGKADWLLFLNPDTRLFADSLRLPLLALTDASNARVGIAGVQLVDERGQVARSCARFPTAAQFLAQALAAERLLPRLGQAMREWDHLETRVVDQVIGAFFLVRGPLFRRLGGFDERFFVYFEEVDLSLRASQAGWQSLYLASAQAFHRGGGTSDQVKAMRLFYSLNSRIEYFRKHGGLLSRLLVGLTTWLIEPFSRLVFLFLKGRFGEVNDLRRAYSKLLASRCH